MDWTLLLIASVVLLVIVSLFVFTGCSQLADADDWPPSSDPDPTYDEVIVFEPNLVGYWPLSEKPPDPASFATMAEDKSGNDNHGEYKKEGGILLQDQPGMVDASSTYFAGGAHVEVPGNPSMNLATFSAEAWVSFDGEEQDPDDPNAHFYTVLDSSEQVPGVEFRGYALYVAPGNKCEVFLGGQGEGENGVSTSGGAISVDSPTHVGVSFDGQFARLFVNGTFINSVEVNSYLTPTNRPLSIGAGLHQGSVLYAFQGRIEKVAVYDTALPDQHFADHFALLPK